MGINFTDRLFVKQTRNAIFIALCVGIVISFIQILYDFNAERRSINQTVIQVINTSKQSAVEAAFSLNNELGQKVVKGIFEYRPIHYAEIIDDFGRRLAIMERDLVEHDLDVLIFFFDKDQNSYRVPLYLNETGNLVGELLVRVDPFLIAQDFLDRAGLIILTGILRNMTLAILIGILFYITLGRPVAHAIKDVTKIDPNRPGEKLLTLPKGHENDELGELVSKINHILIEFDETLVQRNISEDELRRNQNTIKKLNQRLEERVRIRTDELEAANHEMEAFIYSVSHDLRAPLRTIGGFCNILSEEYTEGMEEKARHYLSRIQNSSEKMEKLIDDLLKLSRSTRGDLKRHVFNMSALANELSYEHSHRFPERDIKMKIEEDISAFGDVRFIKLVLDNLISNAVKYTSHCQKTKIEFGRTLNEGEAAFYLSDNGIGFDMKHAEDMFSPFHRLHSARDYEGSGIGLATVHRVVVRHGGKVWAKSEPNKGATFYFTLPRSISGISL